ncbi:decaprenyl-phosphate phosphoribosyltransferase [Phycisphaerales bacterium]|nr:decaprenyl-phosphate phosphoribosyltransferase [Phycisphaerales bacterium]
MPPSGSEPAAYASMSTPGLLPSLLRLARPHQWAKSVFVLIGPLFAYSDGNLKDPTLLWSALAAAVAFSLGSSACYVINDILDAPEDRTHPRKRKRPIASGAVSLSTAYVFAALLALGTLASILLIDAPFRLWSGLTVLVYIANVVLYSLWLKHRVIADVVCLSMGFVLRVLGGCAAVGVSPTTWLLNVTFFLAMFLAFGKRLGERRSMGEEAAVAARRVQAGYTDDLLRLAVIATGVVSLVAYATYVISREADFHFGFNLLWLTILPATYGLFRCIVQLERGQFDDPTELLLGDRPFLASGLMFAAITGALLYLHYGQYIPL